jgi:hypothetical protein
MPAALRKEGEEGEEEEENLPEEEIFEESKENKEGSEKCEDSDEALGGDYIKLYNLSSSSSGFLSSGKCILSSLSQKTNLMNHNELFSQFILLLFY